MAIAQRTQLYLFLGLLAVLAAVVILGGGQTPELAVSSGGGGGKYEPMKLRDPALRLDLIERARELEYAGTHRNIFSATPPPPPPPTEPVSVAPAQPPGPAPEVPVALVVPFKFYGIVTDQKTGLRRGCFTNGEDIFIVVEGGIVQARFRVLKIGNASAEIEEITSGRRATIALEVAAGPPA